jgi:hypothetical protein
MQYAPAGFHYLYRWRTRDTNACEQCSRLNGKEWRDQDLFGSVIWDEFEGDVWNLDLGQPLTHGGSGINCRCTIEVSVTVNLDEIKSLSDLGIILEKPVDEQMESEAIDLSTQIDALRQQVEALNKEASSIETQMPSLRQDVRLINLLMMDLEHLTGSDSISGASQRLREIMALVIRIQLTINAINAAAASPTLFGILYAGANLVATAYMAYNETAGI